jgi:hypothetical protein
LWLTTA